MKSRISRKSQFFQITSPNEDSWKKTIEEKMNQSITNLLYETNEGISTKIPLYRTGY